MKIILLNGPPRVGKDTAAQLLLADAKRFRVPAIRLGFADHLKIATHAAYGILGLGHDFFEPIKDEPLPKFLGLSPRQAYIAHSERYIKPLHGDEFYGQMAAGVLRDSSAKLAIIPDSGFVKEAQVLLREFGAESVTLVRLKMEGRTFAGDSRTYISLPCPTHTVENVFGQPYLLQERLLALAVEHKWYG